MLSEFLVRAQQWRDFATAHSCGLRRPGAAADVHPLYFATAHSCGLRRKCLEIEKDYDALPQRIRAGCDAISAPVVTMLWPLPQRIRAGCDSHRERYRVPVAAFATAHSRGLRRVECAIICSRLIFATAHSRGLRPPPANRKNRIIHFATAHSCGLRR